MTKQIRVSEMLRPRQSVSEFYETASKLFQMPSELSDSTVKKRQWLSDKIPRQTFCWIQQLFEAVFETEGLILAQDERWRRA